jgi:hypothetical protein
MTLGTQTTFVERLARLTGAVTIATASDATKTYINEGVREFSKRVHGLSTEAFVALAPKFEYDTTFAIKFTLGGNVNTYGSTDIPIATTAGQNVTPTNFMAQIVTNVNAAVGSLTISMGWSPSNWVFYINAPASTTFCQLQAPTDLRYTDATRIIFGGGISKTGSITITGPSPQNINLETSLPAGFLEMTDVLYGSVHLRPAPWDIFLYPFSTGQPQYYGVKNKVIRMYPVPNRQDQFEIYYNGMPTDLGTDGSSDSVACPLSEEMHMAPVYWAAACLLDESHEFDKSQYYQGKFNNMCTDYKIREANNNPTMFPGQGMFVPPVITMSSI